MRGVRLLIPCNLQASIKLPRRFPTFELYKVAVLCGPPHCSPRQTHRWVPTGVSRGQADVDFPIFAKLPYKANDSANGWEVTVVEAHDSSFGKHFVYIKEIEQR